MELKEEILYMCGVGLCVSRKTILALLDNDIKQKKASELIKFMEQSGKIKRGELNRDDEKKKKKGNLTQTQKATYEAKSNSYRLDKKGKEQLALKQPEVYEYYLKSTNNGYIKTDIKHLRIYKKTSDVMYMMYKAGVSIGPMKPLLEDIESGKESKLKEKQKTFYIRRELKKDSSQREDKIMSSRSCGVLITPNITALVYRLDGNDYLFGGTIEHTSLIRATLMISTLYEDNYERYVRDCMFVGDSYNQLEDIINIKASESSTKIKNIHDAIVKPAVLGTKARGAKIRFIPMNQEGLMLLNLILYFTEKEIRQIAFSKDELNTEPDKRYEGYFKKKGLECYEFLTSDVTKMEEVKRKYKDKLNLLGIVCMDFQKEFIEQFFRDKEKGVTVSVRTMRSDYIKELIEERRKTGFETR